LIVSHFPSTPHARGDMTTDTCTYNCIYSFNVVTVPFCSCGSIVFGEYLRPPSITTVCSLNPAMCRYIHIPSCFPCFSFLVFLSYSRILYTGEVTESQNKTRFYWSDSISKPRQVSSPVQIPSGHNFDTTAKSPPAPPRRLVIYPRQSINQKGEPKRGAVWGT